MFSLTETQRTSLSRLARRFTSLGFRELLCGYQEPSMQSRENALRNHVPLLPPDLAVCADLFSLGNHVRLEDAERALTPDILGALGEMGVAEVEDGRVSLGTLRLVYHFGVLVFCERMNPAIRLYHGDDSLALARMLMPSRGRVLDLCAGVGTQGLLCAWTADHVVSVEKQIEAARLYRINAALNGVERKMELHVGDFIEPVRGRKFDHICCNPPLLPVPESLPYPLVGDGGPDGLALTRRLLNALPELLAEDGRCHIVGTMLGGVFGPDFSGLREIAERTGMEILMIVPYRARLHAGELFFEALVESSYRFGQIERRGGDLSREQVRELYLDHFRQAGATYLYSFLLAATPAPGGAGRLTHTKHFTGAGFLWSL